MALLWELWRVLPLVLCHLGGVSAAKHDVYASISAAGVMQVDQNSEDASGKLRQLDSALSETRQSRLRKRFQSILDHDEDGIVTRWEAATGILSLGERATMSRKKTLASMIELKSQSDSLAQLGSKPRGNSYLRREERAQTAPSRHMLQHPCLRPDRFFFDSALFIDCVTSRARDHLVAGAHPDEEINGHEELLALHSSAGKPDDMPPSDRNVPKGVTCDEARAKGVLSLPDECPSLFVAGFCHISCRAFVSDRPTSKGSSVLQTFTNRQPSVLQVRARHAEHERSSPSADASSAPAIDAVAATMAASDAAATSAAASTAAAEAATEAEADQEATRKVLEENEQTEETQFEDQQKDAIVHQQHLGPGEEPFQGVPLFASSDWHMEPWFDTAACVPGNQGNGSNGNDWLSRYTETTAANIWKCMHFADMNDANVSCVQSGHNDPPYTHHMAMLNAQKNAAKKDANNSLFFVLGDLQAHDFTPSTIKMDLKDAVRAVAQKAIDMMLDHVFAEQIFIAAGNNDGPQDSIFVEGGDAEASEAWAKVMIESGVVNNELTRSYLVDGAIEDTISLFLKTGYYIKALDKPKRLPYGLHQAKLYVIVLNTNLGKSNARQTRALEDDLDWIKAQNGGVYIIGHHNSPLEGGLLAPMLNQFQEDYTSFIKGVLAGHLHTAADTTQSLFTQVGPVTPGGVRQQDVMFYMTKIQDIDHELNWNLVLNSATWYGQPGNLPKAADWITLPGEKKPDSDTPSADDEPYIPN